jgi:Protein of unknown function (DUF3460)
MIRCVCRPFAGTPRPTLMPMLPARHYESDHTRFIREMKDAKPQLEGEQQRSRALWWDKRPADLALCRQMDEGRIPQPAYVYQGQSQGST